MKNKKMVAASDFLYTKLKCSEICTKEMKKEKKGPFYNSYMYIEMHPNALWGGWGKNKACVIE